jgi:hypothetical protein
MNWINSFGHREGTKMLVKKAIKDAQKIASAKGHNLGDFDTAQYGTSLYYKAQCKNCGARVQVEINGESVSITGHAYTEDCSTVRH